MIPTCGFLSNTACSPPPLTSCSCLYSTLITDRKTIIQSSIILHSEYLHFEKALYVDICQCTITIRPDDVTSSASKTGCSLRLVVKRKIHAFVGNGVYDWPKWVGKCQISSKIHYRASLVVIQCYKSTLLMWVRTDFAATGCCSMFC